MGDHSTSIPSTPTTTHPSPIPTIQAVQERFGRESEQTYARSQPLGPTLQEGSQSTSRPGAIGDAVSTAFDNAPTANSLDPEFMKRLTEQVTEQVLKTLQSVKISDATPPINVPPKTSRSPSRSRTSPTRSSTDSFPPRFTPPSPRQERDLSANLPQSRAMSDAGSAPSKQSWESVEHGKSRQSMQSNEDTPRASQPEMLPRRSKTCGFVGMEENSSGPQAPHSRRRDSLSDATARQTPLFKETAGYFDSPTQTSPRPATVPEDEEMTTLEKIWQPLFDGDGMPTIRLGQFLRGLAKHLIEDYEPKGSLVVTPPKMLRFLKETMVAKECYPWEIIFGGKLSPSSISCMYRKLLCQHHLVQQQLQEPPTIPGLTPIGFEAFMTCLIQAHPDIEYERLATAVQELPISNADDKTERFPKSLTRRLLPKQPNVQAEQRLISSLNHEPVLVPLERGAFAMPPPPPAPHLQSLFNERERTPYSRSNTMDDNDVSPPAIPIERERKPYIAKEGMGKKHEDHGQRGPRDYDRGDISQQRPESSGRRSSRSPRAAFVSPADPNGAAPAVRSHRMSSGPHTTGGSRSRGTRHSPPPRGAYARSDPVDVGFIPPSQHASNLHNPPPGPRERMTSDFDDDRSSSHHPRRAPDRHSSVPSVENDFSNSRQMPQRNVPLTTQSEYDSAYFSGGPPPPPTNGGFAHRRSADQGSERRRSWYQGSGPPLGNISLAPGGGGVDGYGSYAGNGPTYGASGH